MTLNSANIRLEIQYHRPGTRLECFKPRQASVEHNAKYTYCHIENLCTMEPCMFLLHKCSSRYSTFMMVMRRGFRKMSDLRQHSHAKSSVFSTVSFAAVFLFVIFVNFICNLSLSSLVFRTKESFEVLYNGNSQQQLESTSTTKHTCRSQQQLEPTLSRIPLRLIKTEIKEGHSEDQNNQNPPFSVTNKGRINTRRSQQHLVPTSTKIPLPPIKEEIREGHSEEDQDNLNPPFNLTKEERIAWFNKKLPEFEILKSTKLTQQFDARVKEFFRHKCKGQFFMTWIAPAKSFGRREFFAMESLFKSHPDGCLIILSSSMDSIDGNKILKPLLDRGFRVLAVTPDLSSLFKETPAQAWFAEMKSGKKDPGGIPLSQNLSNLLRLAVLYKYGGIYLDMDFIVLKKFTDLRNSIGAQGMDLWGNWTILNNAVLVFEKRHPLLYNFMEEFASTFNGNKWGYNGPFLVSRVIERVPRSDRNNFTILPPMAFYPLDWAQIGSFFRKPKKRADLRWVEAKLLQLSRETYGVHLWNKHSRGLRIEEGSIMGRLISNHCVICKQIYSS